MKWVCVKRGILKCEWVTDSGYTGKILKFNIDGLMELVNGYVRVPEGHVLENVTYNQPLDFLREMEFEELVDQAPIDAFMGLLGDAPGRLGSAIRVHGGITYSDREDDGWWFGFDTGHFTDIPPGKIMEALKTGIPFSTNKDIDFVEHEVEMLAKQLKAIDDGFCRRLSDSSEDVLGEHGTEE